MLSAFRKAGVPMQRIRPAVEILRQEIGLDHALASRNLYSDGAEILYDYDRAHEDLATSDGFSDLYVVRTKQRQFSETVAAYLQRITYGGDGWVTRVELPAYAETKVIVDPAVSFGQPVVSSSRVRVEDLVDRFTAGDSLNELSRDFEISRSEVEDVIRVATRAAD